MQACDACGGSLQGAERVCPHCEINLCPERPTPSEVDRSPLDDSLFPLPGTSIVAVESEQPAKPAPTRSEAPRRGLIRRLGGLAVLVGGVALAVHLTRAPRDPWASLVSDLKAYAANAKEIPPFEPPSPSESLDRLRRRNPDAVTHAESLHRPPVSGEAADLHSLTTAYLERLVQIDPDLGSLLGVHPHPSEVTVVDDVALARVLLLCDEVRRAVDRWRRSGEPTAHQDVDRELLLTLVEVPLPWGFESRESDVLARAERAFDPLVALVTFDCCSERDRIEAAKDRLVALSHHLGRLPDRLKSPPRALVLSAARRLDSIRGYVRSYPALWGESGAELQAASDQAIEALQGYETALRGEVLARSTDVLGIGPQGYDVILRRVDFLDYGAQRLLEDAVAELESTRKQLERQVERLPPAEGPASSRARGGVRDAYPYVVEELRSFQSRWIRQGPRQDRGVVIAPVPSIWEEDERDLYLPPGPLTPSSAEVRPRFLISDLPEIELDSLVLIAQHTAAHEVYPGHHLHHELTVESSCLLRRVYDCRVSQEGWAVYAEELTHESDYHRDRAALDAYERSLDRLSIAFEAAFEVLLQTRAASPDELLRLLADFTGDDELTLADVGDRAKDPGLASTYFVGHRAIRELRQRVEGELGERFDAREFHERLLRSGFVPPSLLETELTR